MAQTTIGDLLDACEDAYDNSDILAGPFNRDGCKITSAPGGGTILAFRGTLVGNQPVDFLDWFNDLRARPIANPLYPGRVHCGFSLSMNSLWQILPLDQLKKPLIITGHSKGGALAQLAGHLLRSMNPRVIVFASPKVGDGVFAGCTSPNVVRYENPHDLVPKEPPIGYVAAGICVFPAQWDSYPQDIRDNHNLKLGYRPWIDETEAAAS